jgi:hypothetical protein
VTALIHAASTWFMAGLIWTMQLIHYPALDGASPETFARNIRRTSALVAPVMLVELACAVLLAAVPPFGRRAEAWTGLGLLSLIGSSTAFVQFPLHRRLARAWDADGFARLRRTNWLRVALWTARGFIALDLLRPAR